MTRHLDSARQLADYATAFDFLGKLSGATTEKEVVEKVFDLFTMLFAPSTTIYLSIRGGEPIETISRSSVPFDIEEAKASMLGLRAEHAWTRSGKGFDIVIGQASTREIIRVEGFSFVEYREHYLNLALNVVPVLRLALTNARNFQLLRDEDAKLRSAILARDMILAVVSHDLRNPLASIALNAGCIERMCRSSKTEERAGHYARSIGQSVERMRRLIEDLLDISRIEAGIFTVRMAECSAADVRKDVLHELRPQADAKGVRFEEKGGGNVLLNCDRDRVVQVLSNLVGNALKFVPERIGVITVACEERGADVLFTVADNGPGIRAQELPHVFDRYWQGREKKQLGAGLGLAIARGIVGAHGGEIWVESVFGEGATFFFTIPRANAGS